MGHFSIDSDIIAFKNLSLAFAQLYVSFPTSQKSMVKDHTLRFFLFC